MNAVKERGPLCHNDDCYYVGWPDTSQKVSFEPKPEIGRTFTLDEFTRFHFSDEGYPPRAQMDRNIRLLHTLLPVNDRVQYYLDTKSIQPILTGQKKDAHDFTPNASIEILNQLDPSSLEYRVQMEDFSPAKLDLFVGTKHGLLEARDNIILNLEKMCASSEATLAEEASYGNKRRLYQLSADNTIPIESLGSNPTDISNRQLYVVVQEKEDLFGNPSISLLLVVDTAHDSEGVQSFTDFRPLFEINISHYDAVASRNDKISSLDAKYHPLWVFNQHNQDPHADITTLLLSRIQQPIDSLPKADASKTIEYKDERLYRSTRLLDLMMFTADAISQALEQPQGSLASVINEETYLHLGDEFERLSHIPEKRLTLEDMPQGTELLLQNLIWHGKDVWEDIQKFTYLMIKAFRRDPEFLWIHLQTTELRRVFPNFKRFQHGELYNFFNSENRNANLSTLVELFCPVPDLYKYHNHRIRLGKDRKENEQSNEYFMGVLLGKSFDALITGRQPISALIEKEGRIMACCSNERDPFLSSYPIHAEVSSRKLAVEKTGDSLLSGCRAFSILETCAGCAPEWKKHHFEEVVFGYRTKIGSETAHGGILMNLDWVLQGYESYPKSIVFYVLRDEVRKFYHMVADVLGDPSWRNLLDERETSKYNFLVQRDSPTLRLPT